MTIPATAFVRHWSHGDVALCGDVRGSRTPTVSRVTCPLCLLEVRVRIDSNYRVHRLIRRALRPPNRGR